MKMFVEFISTYRKKINCKGNLYSELYSFYVTKTYIALIKHYELERTFKGRVPIMTGSSYVLPQLPTY
jgi:hypothetical protein